MLGLTLLLMLLKDHLGKRVDYEDELKSDAIALFAEIWQLAFQMKWFGREQILLRSC